MNKDINFTRNILRIGTRTSPLAIAQTNIAINEIINKFSDLFERENIEIVPINTSGDKNQITSLADIGGKGLFAKELEKALLEGKIDIAIHSCKDMETSLPNGLIIPCILKREDIRDVIISNAKIDLENIDSNIVFGTSSVRRTAQLLSKNPKLTIIPLRGNVETRLNKLLSNGVINATILACAGIKRLAIEDRISQEFNIKIIEPDYMLPAVAQGAIAIQCRENDDKMLNILSGINHEDSYLTVNTEREMLKTIDGSCKTPIAGLAEINKQNNTIKLTAKLYSSDGKKIITASEFADIKDYKTLGEEVGKKIISAGN
jgi:hydroxymethylbilane synthase